MDACQKTELWFPCLKRSTASNFTVVSRNILVYPLAKPPQIISQTVVLKLFALMDRQDIGLLSMYKLRQSFLILKFWIW
jgi:hypothetical protein